MNGSSQRSQRSSPPSSRWRGCSGDDVERRWEHRAVLPSCGTLRLEGGASIQQAGGDQLACLEAAFDAHRGAELEVREPTVEGDLTIEYYRVTAAGTTEVYVDSTRDPNSDETWSFDSCDAPQTALDLC